MIEIYTGTPGSGKSYHIVQKIYKWNRLGFPVISNVRINSDKLKRPELYHFIDSLEMSEKAVLMAAQKYLRDKPKEHSILLVLDECQLFLNARNFYAEGRQDWMHFFSIHRHLGFDVVLISQDMSFIDKQARLLADYEIRHMNVGKIKLFRFFEILLRHRIFLVKTYHIGTKYKCSSDWVFGRKKFYDIYDTFQTFRNGNSERS